MKGVFILIILCIFCLLPSIGLGLFAIFDDDEDNGSCVSPIDEKYDFSNASGIYKICLLYTSPSPRD